MWFSPGIIVNTNIFGKPGGFAEIYAEMMKTTPLGRDGIAMDIAKGIVFFASPLAEWITGINLPIAGGFYGAIPSLKVSAKP